MRGARSPREGRVTLLEPGAQMPAFKLRDPDRETFTEQDLAGQIAVVAFYPMSFTGG